MEGYLALGLADFRDSSLRLFLHNLYYTQMFRKSFCKNQFPHKCINSSVIIKDKLTDLWGNGLFLNNFINTFCEINLHPGIIPCFQMMNHSIMGIILSFHPQFSSPGKRNQFSLWKIVRVKTNVTTLFPAST